MKKQLPFLTGLMLISAGVFAQAASNFFQVHAQNVNLTADIRHARNMPNGDLLLQGSYDGALVFDTITTQGTGENQYLMRLDQNRNVKWVKTFGNTSAIKTSILKTVNKKIFIGGIFRGSLAFEGNTIANPSSNDRIFLMELDSIGNLAQSFPMPDISSNPVTLDIILNNNELSFSFWMRQDSTNIFGQSINSSLFQKNFGALINTDLNGNYKSHFTYEATDGNVRIFESATLNNGDFLTVMSVNGSDSLRIDNQIITHSPRTGLWVLRIDDQGSLKDSTFLKTQGFAGFTLADESPSGKLLLKGSFSDKITKGSFSITNSDQPNPFFLQDGAYILLDQNLNIQAMNALGIEDNNTNIAGARFRGSNEEIIMTGTASGELLLNGDPTFFNSGGKTESYVLLLNPNGTLNRGMRTKGASQLTQIESEGLLINPDGTFSIYGEANTDFTIYQSAMDTLFRKSNRVGFLWNFNNFVSVPEFTPHLYREKLSLYPNPVEQRLYLKNDSRRPIGERAYRLSDMQGHLLREGTLTREGVYVQDLQPGVYLLSLPDNRGEWKSYKFLKQ